MSAERPLVPRVESTGERILFVDLARALAVLMMVQGHTLNVLLAPVHRDNSTFDTWLFVRGLTSCLFFFLAGFAFTVATTRHWENFCRPSTRFWRRLRKFAFFLLLGYALHFPVYQVADLRTLGADGWLSFLQVDVLQMVAATLIGLQLLVVAVREPRRLAMVSAVGALTIVLLTPLFWPFPWRDFVSTPVAAFLGGQTGSPFPLFPWAAYLLAGVTVGYLHLARTQSRGALSFSAWLLRAGFVVGGMGMALEGIGFNPHGEIDFWKSSPVLFLIRLGCVLILLSAICAVAGFLRRLPPVVSALAQESLSVYAVHVCILYGSIWNLGLAQRIGAQLSVAQTLGWMAVMLVTMCVLARGWNWAKKAHPPRSRLARAAFALALAYRLL